MAWHPYFALTGGPALNWKPRRRVAFPDADRASRVGKDQSRDPRCCHWPRRELRRWSRVLQVADWHFYYSNLFSSRRKLAAHLAAIASGTTSAKSSRLLAWLMMCPVNFFATRVQSVQTTRPACHVFDELRTRSIHHCFHGCRSYSGYLSSDNVITSLCVSIGVWPVTKYTARQLQVMRYDLPIWMSHVWTRIFILIDRCAK